MLLAVHTNPLVDSGNPVRYCCFIGPTYLLIKALIYHLKTRGKIAFRIDSVLAGRRASGRGQFGSAAHNAALYPGATAAHHARAGRALAETPGARQQDRAIERGTDYQAGYAVALIFHLCVYVGRNKNGIQK